ncbi:cell division protein FtsI/penicillin-binding protein 2 [Thermocatellispora tengchongensis]|uniref:Cell division protein FtsI/penicillin-binding protein 2 n=1 Tax=Thermocatellispora tengchongensis TaxID=1073253 RepID=A0A840P1D6_9ACTN|nr:cell division protein FtsI/penicillin-binding protein 2 [Thermocatellispora tengchongensis]
MITVLAVGAAAGGAYYVLHTRGTPGETATRYLQAWQRGDLAAMRAELAAPAQGFDQAYASLGKALGVTSTSVSLSGVREGDGSATAAYKAVQRLATGGEWSYDGSLRLVVKDRRWKVDWSPAAVHPDLTAQTKLALKTTWPERARITDADGERIDDGDDGGSVQQLVGWLDKATDKDVKQLGVPYEKGDPVGRAGLQATFQKRLAGRPTTTVELVGGGGKRVKKLGELEGAEGEDVRTTLDLSVQRAAVEAVRGLDKPASLVAIRPGTGEILAVVNNRGGFNRALDGNYPPGSTFKAVTALGLLAEGMSAGQQVSCPKYVTVGGLKIRNSEHAEYGSLSLSDAFAHSCNTTFAPLAAQRLGAAKLLATAEMVGFNQPLNIGVPATKASLPKAQSDAELAAESFGQARITSSPLVMASVAAAIASGTWHPPTLVPSIKQKAEPVELPSEATEALRSMMSAVVTKGTAKKAGLPSGTRGKTGTAEYGTGEKLDSHAWFIGYRGEVAFAVVVEGGGGGGAVAAPIAATFLKALP